ncbi:MAG: hypothetical protein CME21_15765 [Gemmatimonadetes bacterium]|jgi:uncharacterized protein YdiU (UPF0061 family)|nr:hypothetical protein [Gemmatimonadota bacterium]HCK08385.1 YdiU family protein [Candidatus Latescibacterota bacterium]
MLETLNFDNKFTQELPADPETKNFRRQVTGACYSRVQPTPVAKPELIANSREMAQELGIPQDYVECPAFAEVFSGNRLADGMDPYAMCYGGHQFGNWAAQLGDGRAINLGEVVNAEGRRWVLQLKGAGPTPYSRMADGLAVLRSSVREFLCSEAMHHLGVPTTRALSLVTTGENVVRDMFYDGHPKEELGAVVCRVSPSFIRFGNFQIFSARQEHEVLRKLVDYTIQTDFPQLGAPSKDTYLQWFDEVCRRTAKMIVHWMRVGFVHGVMNTDNMSILGLTIDYGPYGWLEDFDPNWTPNTTDAQGRRYRFGHQSQIAHWNLLQLGQAIYPLIEEVEPLQEIVNAYQTYFDAGSREMMAAKLGLAEYVRKTDDDLVSELHAVLQSAETDMTIFYRRLAKIKQSAEPTDDSEAIAPLRDSYYVQEQLTPEVMSRVSIWLRNYRERIRSQDVSDEDRAAMMNSVNPKYVLRNYLAQVAIDKAEQGDPSMIGELLESLRRPYDEQPESETFAEKRPDWARTRPGCSMLSCSS